MSVSMMFHVQKMNEMLVMMMIMQFSKNIIMMVVMSLLMRFVSVELKSIKRERLILPLVLNVRSLRLELMILGIHHC
jgi:hypothetical protein